MADVAYTSRSASNAGKVPCESHTFLAKRNR